MSLPNLKPGDYLLCVSGPTYYAPYLAGWRDFKDHIRKIVKEQPGWTDTYSMQGRRGEVQGWCKLKDREDADAVYNHISKSRGVMVHVFSTSLQNSVFDLMKCNCIVQFPDVGSRGHSPRRSGVDVNSVNQTFGNRCAYTTPQPGPLPAQPMYPYGNHHRAAAQNSMYAYPAHHHVQPAAVQVPAYSQSTAGLRVNLGQGAVITEARGIFIQGLSYSARDSDLASLLHNVGLRPVEFKVRKDSKGSSKGTATAKFGSKEEAQHGVKYLNGKLHMGKKLAVRLDLESTIVGHIDPVMVQRDPVIVDGTNRYGSGY